MIDQETAVIKDEFKSKSIVHQRENGNHTHTDQGTNNSKKNKKDKQINRQTYIFSFQNRFLNNNFKNKFTIFFSSKFQMMLSM
jgi:hypothetical protein